MGIKSRALFVVFALTLLSIFVAACGDSSDEPSGGSETSADTQFPAPTEAPDDAAEGGNLKVLAVGDVDYIDPGAAYYQFSYMVTSATQRQLQSWAPDDLEEPTPDIATEPPTISEDGKTITYKLQSGIKYSPPLDRDVVCDDFKYSIERSLLPGVANGYVGLYLTDIVGFADAQKAVEQAPTKAPDMAGITCKDDQTLEITLTDTSELGVIGALGLPIGSPVPRDYAEKFDA
jgi:ABC-type transport system substrate-binding protein